MPDDFKLSVDIEANLTKLDNTLNLAQQKVAMAGANMQRSLDLSVGGGATAMSPIAGGQQGGTIPGTGISFGGGLNASAGNGQRPSYNLSAEAVSQLMGGGAGRGGVNKTSKAMAAATRLGAYSFAGYAAFKAADTLIGIAGGERQLLLGRSRGDQVAEYEGAGQIQQTYESVPILGNLLSSYRKATNGTDYTASASARRQARDLNLQNKNVFGGLDARKREIDFEQNVAQPATLAQMASNGVDRSTLQELSGRQTEHTYAENKRLKFDTNQALLDIKSSTAQSRLRTMGLGGLADIEAIKQSHRSDIALADQQGETGKKIAESLRTLQSSEIVESIMGNMQNAQEVNPASASLGSGSVRLGSTQGQDPGTVYLLSKIADNTASGGVVGRN